MDRPVIRTNLHAPDPALGPYVLEAPYPADLAQLVQNQLAVISAALTFPAVVCSWNIAGGGGGANWRVSFDVALNPGWGLNTSPPVSLSSFVCDVAQNAAELRTVTQRLLLTIPSDAAIWGIKQVGSGRDGTYLVGIWYSTGAYGSGLMTYSAQYLDPQGPYTGSQILASITIPASVGGSAYTVREYMLHYAVALEDTTGASGVFGRLEVNSAMIAENSWSAPAGEWRNFSGHWQQNQLAGGPVVVELFCGTAGANNVTVRGVALAALLINSGGAET